jgi:hypothetical protein
MKKHTILFLIGFVIASVGVLLFIKHAYIDFARYMMIFGVVFEIASVGLFLFNRKHFSS